MRRAELRNAFSRGVLDPELRERYDLAHYYLSLADARNQIVLPQGGLIRRPGTAKKEQLRRKIEPILLNSQMVTLHSGGIAANLISQDPAVTFITDPVTLPAQIVAEIDLGVAQTVAFVDIKGFLTSIAGVDRALSVEYYDGTQFRPMAGSGDPTLSPYKHLRTTARTRRFGTVAGSSPTARFWRIVVYNAAAAGTITIASVRFWREKAELSPVRLVAFAKTADEAFQVTITDRNLDIFRSGQYMASVAVPLSADLITQAKTEQSLDTLFLFHCEMETQQVVKQGAPDEWNAAFPPLTSVPILSANTAFTGNADEIQALTFNAISAGAKFILFLGDLFTAPIAFDTPANMALSISAAIEALPGISSDNIIVTTLATNPIKLKIAFVNSNGQRRWPKLSATILSPSTGNISCDIIQRGVDTTKGIIAPETGYPGCGALFANRLILSGMRSAPQTLLYSRAGNQFNFTNTGSPITADMGIIFTMASDQVETIYDIVVGQHLHILTERGEWWAENRTIDATAAVNMILASRYGVAQQVPTAQVDGGLMFVQAGGQIAQASAPCRTVRNLQYSQDVANYTADIISLLAPHLLTDVVDMNYRPGATASHATLVIFINRDGTAAILTYLKSQDIVAMTPIDTPGFFRGAALDVTRTLWLVVERGGQIYLERFDDNLFLDAAITQTAATPFLVVTGLIHLEGQSVYAYADRNLVGPYIVSGGQIALDVPALSATVGLFAVLSGKTLPLREKLQQEQPFKPPVRVYEVEFSVSGCGPFQLAANGGAYVDVPMFHLDGTNQLMELSGDESGPDVLDAATLDALYTGTVKVENLLGWTKHGIIAWQQTVPAPFHIRSLRYQAAYK